jgi:hypothetical protein
MTTEKFAREIATSWFRAATPPGSMITVNVVASSGGWLATATVDPRPSRPLPMLQIGESGVLRIVGGPQFGPMSGGAR